MTTPAPEQRRILGAFLRARREALPPSQRASARRPRTPGLRREEVAEASGLSTTWYAWIEQGRDISLSAQALARLADALKLSRAERAYLFELTRRRDPAPPPLAKTVAPELADLVHATTAPAYLLDRLWRVQAWNAPAAHLLAPWFESGEACLLRYVFLEPSARNFIYDWATRARRLLAEFRADTAVGQDDAEMRALVRDLLAGSGEFEEFWTQHAVLAREGGSRRFYHPEDGLIEFEQVTLVPPAHPDMKVVVLLPGKAVRSAF